MAGAAGVLMLPVERAGVLQRIDGQTDALAVPGIAGLSITIPLGQAVRPLPWGDRYLGFLFAAGREIGEVEAALRDAYRKLRGRHHLSGPCHVAERGTRKRPCAVNVQATAARQVFIAAARKLRCVDAEVR